MGKGIQYNANTKRYETGWGWITLNFTTGDVALATHQQYAAWHGAQFIRAREET